MMSETTSKPSSHTKKRLRFASNDKLNEVYLIGHWKDMSKDEIKNCYYNRHDMAAMKQMCTDLVALAKYINEEKQRKGKENCALDKLKLHTRGLERHVCVETAVLRRECMENALQDVLEEQMHTNYTCCPNDVAKLYANATYKCQQDAYQRGLSDERIAANAYNADENGVEEIDDVNEFLKSLPEPKSTKRSISSSMAVWSSSSTTTKKFHLPSSSSNSNTTSSSSIPKLLSTPITTIRKKMRRSGFNINNKRKERSIGSTSPIRLLQVQA